VPECSSAAAHENTWVEFSEWEAPQPDRTATERTSPWALLSGMASQRDSSPRFGLESEKAADPTDD
jgi:hypothetical protein